VRILYVASDQTVPGSTGGSVHVLEVSRGLADRGHEVHAVVAAQDGLPAEEERAGARVHRIRWTPASRFFRFRAQPAVEAIAREVRAQVVLERYYNFGGEGVGAAATLGVPSVLEVNSPIVDHPGSWKARLDAAALVRPLRRRREALVRRAAALVAPLREIVPAFAREKTEVVTWGANVDAFDPARRNAAGRAALGAPEGATVVLFAGSFRPWHGVHVLEAAARRLRDRADIWFALVGGDEVGDAPSFRGRRLGRIPYDRMPELVASADIATAPYDVSRLEQLRLGFYWSPLKVFEAMASGLPTITLPVFPLTEIVRDAREGLHAASGDDRALADAIVRLADDPEARAAMGRSARARVVERYSWARHCEQLERVLARVLR
jgi:starch synthase